MGAGELQFTDITARSGVDFVHRSSATAQKYLPETMSGGVALLDYDGDGWLDIYFVNGAELLDPQPKGQPPSKEEPQYWNRLYRNQGDGAFEDVTEEAALQGVGYGQGVAAGDYDADGAVDLYLTNIGGNTLLRNDGDGWFEDVTESAGVGATGWPASAAFLDFDADGDLDLFVSRYLEWSFETNRWCGDTVRKERAYCHPRYFEPVSHLLFRNDGKGHFTDVSADSGIAGTPGKGLGVAVDDFDGDGQLDIFVANDKHPQQLFLNRGDTWEEAALLAGVAYDGDGETYSGMGVAAGDIDGDGRVDLFVNALALQGYAVYANRGEAFDYVSEETGMTAVSNRHSGWGTGLYDFDNDGDLDLFVAQGHVMDNIESTQPGVRYRENSLLLRNSGGRFVDASAEAGKAFQEAHAARGAAFGDLDNDGDIDIVVNNNDEPATILRNDTQGHHWLIVDTGALGDRVAITHHDGTRQVRTTSAAGSYMSSSDPRAHFGLGSRGEPVMVEVVRPGGASQRLEGVELDQIVRIPAP